MLSRLFVGQKVRLTEVKTEDLAEITRAYRDSEFSRHLEAVPGYPHTQKHWEQWYADTTKQNDGFLFAIRPVEEDTFIGWVELDSIIWASRVGWISVAIAQPEYRDRGYGTEALTLLLNFAFDELNLYRVQLTVFEYNARAIKVYEKLGFIREGIFREFLQRDGTRYDMILYAMLHHEWTGGNS